RTTPELLWGSRERLAHFLGGDPRRLVFTSNVSTSINIIAASLELSSPGEILMTDHEYGSMQWCWERHAARQGLTVRTFALPRNPRHPGEIVDAAIAAFRPDTRMLFFSHVLSPTGMVLPAAELCAEARRRGILSVVDAAHAPGFLPIRMDSIGADFFAGNCHKWVLAPIGCGFLYLGTGMEDRLQPLQVSWGWKNLSKVSADERDEFGSTPRIRRLEFEGTRDCCLWLVVPDAIAFQEALGWEKIWARQRQLAAHVRERITCIPLATPPEASLSGAMTAFELPPEVVPDRLREALWNARIEALVAERAERNLFRVSTHVYNTEAEVDRLADLLPGMLAKSRRA
ncbi:MAG: aminotransferase class V-fold PLP-dependent enzyme, partial [Gemmataceae bacterium]